LLKNVNSPDPSYSRRFFYFRYGLHKEIMRVKTIFIIVITVLVTVILMKNMDEVSFWIFGDRTVPKLAVLATMFFIGAIVGYLIGRPRRKTATGMPMGSPDIEATKPPLDPSDEDYIR